MTLLHKPETTITKEPICPLCGQPCHAELYNKFGTNERGDITGNLIEAFTQKKGKELNILKHPFYLQTDGFSFIRTAIEKGKKVQIEEVIIPDAPEGHHLITCEAAGGKDWKDIFEAFGYNINDAQNGVFFPGDMFVACGLQVPLHMGNHGATFGEANYLDLKNAITYVKAVKNMIEYILKMKENNQLCEKLTDESVKNFNKTMFDHSNEIFDNIKDFVWTITADGLDYDKGGLGCYNRYRTITKKRDGMKLENTASLKGARNARAVSAQLSINLANKGKCDRKHKKDGCKPNSPFTDWYKKCRYNEFDEGRFQSV